MSFVWDGTTLAIIALIASLFTIFLVWYFTRPLPDEPKGPEVPLPLESIHLRFDDAGDLYHHSRLYKEQSEEWKSRLKKSGQILKSHKVNEIILLHGTFVGSDPINVMSTLKSVFPKLGEKLESGVTEKFRTAIDSVAQDNGNFIPAYAELLQTGLDAKIPVNLFYWSSSNHHFGRLEGALGLLQRMAKQPPKDRTLLIGHSHARQVFALFTHLYNAAGDSKATGAELWNFIEDEGLASEGLQNKIAAIKKNNPAFDFVTLGGPVRYKWCYLPGMKVLHIVNHQGETTEIKNAWTFWNTSSGDYVQQWGMIGSDNLAPTPRERTLNRRLDDILGKGWHTRLWMKTIVKKNRLGDFGRTLLVDYFHNPKQKSNFIKTVFGHGVYTRFDVMQFQIELICKYMYEKMK